MRVSCGLLGVVVGLVGFAGCGGGGGGGGTPNPSPTPVPGASSTISIAGDRGAQSFTPNPAPVQQGRALAWRNADSVVHRIMSNDGSFDTGDIAPGATSQVITLNTDGTNYHCTIHPGMIGAINSAAGAPPPCTGIYC